MQDGDTLRFSVPAEAKREDQTDKGGYGKQNRDQLLEVENMSGSVCVANSLGAAEKHTEERIVRIRTDNGKKHVMKNELIVKRC